MKQAAVLIILVFLLAGQAAPAIPAGAQEDIDQTVSIGGLDRSFHIHFPPDYDPEQPAPLAVVLHGAGSDGAEMMTISHFNTPADAAGFIVVYPDAGNAIWNSDVAPDPDNGIPDDVAFIRAVIDSMTADYAIDPARIYLAGYSSGGLMAFRAGCALSDRLAAVAVIGANLSFPLASGCLDAGPLSFLIVLGTRDRVFPWQGYASVLDDGTLITSFSMAQTMEFLSSLNACSSHPPTATGSEAVSPVQVIRDVYSDCRAGVEIRLDALIDADHNWPGSVIFALSDDRGGLVQHEVVNFLAGRSRP